MMELFENCIQLNISVSQRNGKPFIHLSKDIYKTEEIKNIIQLSINNGSILAFPNFSDKIKCLSSLIEKKILKYNKEIDRYEFII